MTSPERLRAVASSDLADGHLRGTPLREQRERRESDGRTTQREQIGRRPGCSDPPERADPRSMTGTARAADRGTGVRR